MDEKTAELRDIFIDTTGSDTVTENQAESPGSLTEERTNVDERLTTLIGRMRERYEFRTDLDDDDLLTVVRGFHAGDSADHSGDDAPREAVDREIAADLDCSAADVRTARLDLHLVGEADRETAVDLDRLRRLVVDDVPVDARAERLDITAETARYYSEVVAADLRSTRANNRFRDEFAELLTDSDLTGQLATDAREDGLREATEDIETDVSF